MLEDLVPVPEGACFVSTDSSLILRIEVQHDICLCETFSKADFCACLVRQGEVRGQVADLHPASYWLCLVILLAHRVSSSGAILTELDWLSSHTFDAGLSCA